MKTFKLFCVASFIATVFFLLTFMLTSANGQPLPAVTVSAPSSLQTTSEPVVTAAAAQQIAEVAIEAYAAKQGTNAAALQDLKAEVSELRAVLPGLLKNAVQNMATNQNLFTTNGTVNPEAVKAGIISVTPDQYKGLVEALIALFTTVIIPHLTRALYAWKNNHSITSAVFCGTNAPTKAVVAADAESAQLTPKIIVCSDPDLKRTPPPNTVATPLQQVSMYQPAQPAQPAEEPTTVAK